LAGIPAFDAAPNGVGADSTFALLFSAFGFFFSRLPFDIRNSFSPTQCRLLTLGELSAARVAKAVQSFHKSGRPISTRFFMTDVKQERRRQIGIAAK
jgi:hypothetical protein